jgi:hypothetical protein
LSQRWRKLGLLVESPPPVSWAKSHAMMPIAEAGEDGQFRLLFTSRDERNRSHVGSARLDVEHGTLDGYSRTPLLSPGELGAFDDSGAMGSCLIRHGGREHLYYIGWSLGITVPFYTFIGCAVSDDSGRTFTRVSQAPILPRSQTDPYLTTAPWVLVDGGTWRMWYVSGTGWEPTGGRPMHRYHIRYAESDDGLEWRRDGRVSIDYANDAEYAIARPCVVREGDLYRMWFCHRGEAYRMGYAESSDGLLWTRKDAEAGIDVSTDGWDSEMVEYPFVFDDGGRRYLLYNGNGYGMTGIGWAILDP